MGLRFFLLVALSIALLAAVVAGVVLIGGDGGDQTAPVTTATVSLFI